jgi:hypothetical protein
MDDARIRDLPDARVRGQKSGGRRQKSEVRSQKSEVRRQEPSRHGAMKCGVRGKGLQMAAGVGAVSLVLTF